MIVGSRDSGMSRALVDEATECYSSDDVLLAEESSLSRARAIKLFSD